MDSLTHIVLGAATGQAIMGKKVGNKALFWGAIAGSLPDFDVFVTPILDPVYGLFFHRGPSHALLFAAIAAPVMGLIATRIHKDRYFKQWSIMSFLAILIHSTIDIFNTYGTALLLPFNNARLAFDSIGIIDIMLLFPLVTTMVLLLLKPQASSLRQKLSLSILAYTLLFVGFTVVNKLHIEKRFTAQLKEQGIDFMRIKTAPLPITNFLWLALAEDSTGYHYGYISNFDKQTVELNYIQRKEENLGGFIHNDKIINLIRFTDNLYTVEQMHNGSLWLHDLRFGSMAFDEDKWYVFSFEISGTPENPVISRAKPNRRFSSQTIKMYWKRLRKDL